MNGAGALATGLVSIVQVFTKFTHGAWIVVLIIPLIILMLRGIHQHYAHFSEEIKFDGVAPIVPLHHTVIVPCAGITKAVAGALVYATTISDDVRAVAVEVETNATEQLKKDWEAWDVGIDLVVLPSPYRSVLRPLVDYVDSLRKEELGELVTVVVPEIVPQLWWQHLLHNKTALYIRTAFLFKSNVVVTSVPFHLGHAARLSDMATHDELMDEDRLMEAGVSA